MDNTSECVPECKNDGKKLGNVRRPMNAFFIFCKRHRNIVRDKYPHLENRCITKILAEWWASLDPPEKASYTTLAKQYKEAFMKAHPDFKWYKLPPPPPRTLVTRPSNRVNQIQDDKNGHKSYNCGINLGKLVDDEQLGNLSSLINTTVSGSLSAPTDYNLQNSSMAQKGADSILKPPKKRYIINGEFQSHSDVSSVDNRDFQTRNACSALLELAEVCTNTPVLGNSSVAAHSTERINNSLPFTSPLASNVKYSSTLTDSLDLSLPGPAIMSNPEKPGGLQNLSFTSLNIHSNDRLHHGENLHLQQDQPLDLCKNKEKTEFLGKESSKTITTSHQQLIDHFVDKFLCDTPVPPNKFYKSEIIDPAFCKLFSERSLSNPSSSEGTISHSAFTLSVAIESAVDKAYSKDCSKSTRKGIPESNVLLDCVTNNSQDFNMKFKSSEQNFERPASSAFDDTIKKYLADSTSIDKVSNISNSHSQTSKQESTDIPGCSSSKYFCKLISPPKKSSVWCNLFMNEQLTKSSIESSSNIANSLGSDLSSPARRSSQRTCKGRRYQALITEGLLQSPKERKQSNSKKIVSPLSKVKNKINSMTENHIFNSPKRKKIKDSPEKKEHPADAFGLSSRNFDLEKQIASLPKCDIETLSKKTE